MIDGDLVYRKLTLIAQDLEPLQRIASKDLAAFLQSASEEVLAERYLERVIGRMIDINYHIITEAGQPPPADYYQSFLQLGRIGVLENVFAQQVAACAGLRNRIVHEYDEIDSAKLFEGVQKAQRDIPRYMQLVRDFVEKTA